MILDKTVSVKIYSKNLKRYKEKYNCVMGDIIDVDLVDIDKHSSRKVNVECDDCKSQKYLQITNHNRHEKYYCQKCSMKHRENPFSNPEIIEKIKKIKKEKYGENYEKIREKREKTMIERYGVKNALENKDIIDKMKLKINKHDDDMLKKIQEKREKSLIELYGDDYNYNFKEKREKTMIERYGVKNALENKDIIDKMKLKINNRTEEEKDEIIKKHKKTCNEKYGFDFASQNEKVKEKVRQTRIEKGYISDPLLKTDWEIYFNNVRNLTRMNKKDLYTNWDGFDFYDNEYIAENLLLNSNDRNFPTIDHKKSVYSGFIDNIPEKEISDISNLCITKKHINSSKGNKKVFKI